MFTRRLAIAVMLLLTACASAPRAIEAGEPVTAFTNVTVISEYGGERLARHTVAVRGDRIIAIGRDGSITLPEGSRIIDGGGRLLAPGLADMHVHYQDPSVGVLMLANSITTIRNPSGFGVGNGPETTLGLAASIARGEVVGPFIYSSGQLIDGPTHDFNLMWRRDRVRAELWHRPLVGPMVLFVEPGTTWAVYLIAGQACFGEDSGLPPMAAGDSAIFQAGDTRMRHVLDGGGEVLLIRIEPLQARDPDR